MKFLTGILRAGVFYEAPAWEPASEEPHEQDSMDKSKPTNALTSRFQGLSDRIEAERRKSAEPDDAIALGPAVELLAALRLRYAVTLNGDKVSVRGPEAPDEQTCDRIRQHKAGLIRLLEAERP